MQAERKDRVELLLAARRLTDGPLAVTAGGAAVLLGVTIVLLMGSQSNPVSIYVGPNTRDGFVDVDKGISESIKDIQKELRKKGAFTVVADESAATLRLFVIVRRAEIRGESAVITSGNSTASGQDISTTVSVPNKVNRLETTLRIGEYERTFVGESDWVVGGWKRCAKALVQDLSAWVAANRERIE